LIYGGHWWEDLKNLSKAAKESPRLNVVHPVERKMSPEEGRRLHGLAHESFLLKRLLQIPHSSISRKELLQISMEYAGEENAKEIVKLLDDSGQILIVGSKGYGEQLASAKR
jgi:hypothetical protein